MAPSRGRRWQTANGRATIARIVREKIPEWKNGLHEWQLVIVAWILDGHDVLCITATGDGKSAIFAVPIIVLLEVARNPAAYPGFAGQKTPVGIVISPTKGLTKNIVFELEALGVSAFAYTSEEVAGTRDQGRNIAQEIANCRWSIIVVSPEHLIDKGWEGITDAATFRANLAFCGVDEGHLVDEWGPDFRDAFLRIGHFMRGRLPSHISVFALTATLLPGAVTRSVCKSLGFQTGPHFHLERRSNERVNVQFLIYPLTHSLGGSEFPDLLRWLCEGRKTVLYCATIEQCWRVYLYLLRLLPPGPTRARRIRLYHGLCWPDENDTTIRMMREDPLCQVIIATIAFAQGINIKTLLDSIQLGVAKSVPQTLQQGGRVGRDPSTSGRSIVLVQSAAFKSAQKYIEDGDAARRSKAKNNSKTLTTMNNEKALMLTERGCLCVMLNKMFGNKTPGALVDCILLPRALPCSNCLPQFTGPLPFGPSPLPPGHSALFPFRQKTASATPLREKKIKLTRKMRPVAETSIVVFRARIYKRERGSGPQGFTPLTAYLPSSLITALLDNLLQITDRTVLEQLMPRWKHHTRHGADLLALLFQLQEQFNQEFEAARLERNRVNRAKAKAKRPSAQQDSDIEMDAEEEEDTEVEKETNEGEDHVQEEPPVQPRSTRKRAITLRDSTNDGPTTKRPRAARAAQKTMAEVAAELKPQYNKSSRRRTLDNDTENGL